MNTSRSKACSYNTGKETWVASEELFSHHVTWGARKELLFYSVLLNGIIFFKMWFFFSPMSSLECQFHVSLTSSPEDFLLWYQPFLLLPLKLAYELRRKPVGAACRQSLNAHARSRLQWWLWCRDADVLQCISQSTWQDYFFCGWDKEVCQIR